MKRFQIQAKLLDEPQSEWKTLASADEPRKAIRLAENLRPPRHLARVFDWNQFESICDIDAMGVIRQGEKV